MSELLNKFRKSSKLDHVEILSESSTFNKTDFVDTGVPILNVALTGHLDRGFTSGVTMFAGPSKHFKTAFSLLMARAFLDKYPDAIMMFYDSEFGSPPGYFKSFGIDTSRVLHCPIEDIEQLKFDLTHQLNQITKNDRVIIVIDSIGNLASKKEVEDALDEKSAADMTRAKQLKSLFRIITPKLTLRNIPLIAINHTYKELCLSGDTPIKVAGTDTGIKLLKDIEVGDRVYGTTGIQTVTHHYTPEQLDGTGKEYLQLTFDDGSTVDCTGDHLFLTSTREWVPAGELQLGTLMA